MLIWLWTDAFRAFDFGGRFGIGLGTLIMLLNVALLSGFTFGCHALRNLRVFVEDGVVYVAILSD